MAPRGDPSKKRGRNVPNVSDLQSKVIQDTPIVDAFTRDFFVNNFGRRHIMEGRVVDFDSLNMPELKILFGNVGWLPIMTSRDHICPRLIKDFYVNMSLDGLRIESSLKGRRIEFNPPSLASI